MNALRDFLTRVKSLPLYALYLFYAIPAGLFLAAATPPFQTPDAANHFFRALHVAEGHILGERIGAGDADSGGRIDSAAVKFANLFESMKFHSDVKLSKAALTEGSQIAWSGVDSRIGFANTAIYPAYSYAPQAVAIKLGRLLRMKILQAYRLACLVDLIFSVSLTCLAIALARRCRLLIFATALLPTTVMLFSSVSQDAVIIPTFFFLIACFDWLVDSSKTLRVQWLIFMGLGFLLCISSRPPYAGLLLMFLCPGLLVGGRDGRYEPVHRVFLCGVIGLIAVAAAVIFEKAAWFIPTPPRSVGGQFLFLMQNPGAVPKILINTLVLKTDLTYKSFIGVLGWLDAWMSGFFYWAAGAMLLLAIVGSVGLGRDRPKRTQRWDRVVSALALLSCAGMVYVAMYLTWTAVGGSFVEGVQGRYLICMFPLIGLLLPLVDLARQTAPIQYFRYLRRFALLVVLIFPIYTYMELVHTILVRYYLA
jgi:uncharacterized membrane protein